MLLKANEISRELKDPPNPDDPMIITPRPDEKTLETSGAASLDIRLGCWFLTCRPSRTGFLDVYQNHTDIPNEAKLDRKSVV